jgi:hypothetical protein
MALGAPESLVYEACAEPYRDTQVGLELEAAMVHESRDDEVRRIDASFANASRLAASAAHLDPKFAAFAAAQSYWGEHASDPGALNDPQLEAAIEVVSQVCTDVGVPNGNEFVTPPMSYPPTRPSADALMPARTWSSATTGPYMWRASSSPTPTATAQPSRLSPRPTTMTPRRRGSVLGGDWRIRLLGRGVPGRVRLLALLTPSAEVARWRPCPLRCGDYRRSVTSTAPARERGQRRRWHPPAP